MKKDKGILQKSAYYSSFICFLASIICLIFLYFKIDELGLQNPVSASFLASSFFFIFVGVVLYIIGTSDIPSFKFGNNPD